MGAGSALTKKTVESKKRKQQDEELAKKKLDDLKACVFYCRTCEKDKLDLWRDVDDQFYCVVCWRSYHQQAPSGRRSGTESDQSAAPCIAVMVGIGVPTMKAAEVVCPEPMRKRLKAAATGEGVAEKALTDELGDVQRGTMDGGQNDEDDEDGDGDEDGLPSFVPCDVIPPTYTSPCRFAQLASANAAARARGEAAAINRPLDRFMNERELAVAGSRR